MPTLLIDEADTFLKTNRGAAWCSERVIARGSIPHRWRCTSRRFSTWAPAAIAMIGRLPDTLEDRSVSVSLRRRKPTGKGSPVPGRQIYALT